MSELGADRLAPEGRVARRGVFGGEADRYDRTRPAYPADLFDAIAAYGRLEPGSRVLEIGPGTGQATVGMLDRGWRVQAVELDPAMAALARRRTGGRVEVRVGAFEEQPAPDPPVDLVLAATSFHWLDPRSRLQRIAAALRPGGAVAVVWSRHVRGGTQAFFDAVQPCSARHGGDDPAMRLLDESDITPRTAEFEESSAFDDVVAERFAVELEYRTAVYLDLLRTYSDTIALPDADRAALLGCVGEVLDREFAGRVVKRMVFDLVLARRR